MDILIDKLQLQADEADEAEETGQMRRTLWRERLYIRACRAVSTN